MDVAQPLWPAWLPPNLSLTCPGTMIEFVVRHQDFVGLDLVEARQRGHRACLTGS
jgi:hypothetical protein